MSVIRRHFGGRQEAIVEDVVRQGPLAEFVVLADLIDRAPLDEVTAQDGPLVRLERAKRRLEGHTKLGLVMLLDVLELRIGRRRDFADQRRLCHGLGSALGHHCGLQWRWRA